MNVNLFTVCVDGQPVVVVNAGAAAAVPDFVVTNPELLRAQRAADALMEMMPSDVRRGAHLQEVENALDTWLGEDLVGLRHHGVALWNGDRARVQVRDAQDNEAAQWKASYEDALRTGEQEAGDEDWVIFLVEVDA